MLTKEQRKEVERLRQRLTDAVHARACAYFNHGGTSPEFDRADLYLKDADKQTTAYLDTITES